MNSEASDAADWARTLKSDWQKRSQSPSRDFFIASHPGWDNPQRWQEEAVSAVNSFLLGIDRDGLRNVNTLEIGCGVGRLAPVLLDVVGSYTGIDIAPGMIEEARRRCADLDAARFFEGDGLSIPAAARDREYGLVLAIAVFIHCPQEVIASILRDAWELLGPGGVLRAQFRGDSNDPHGIDPGSAEAAVQMQETAAQVQEEVTKEQADLIDDHPYMGHAFAHEELRSFLSRELPAAEATLFRPDPFCIYAALTHATAGNSD